MTETPKPDATPSLKELSGRIGKYEIMKPLGKGAMGIVYLAHDTVLERDIALKVMVATIADDPELNDRFKREAKAVAKMAHPNVVNVFDLGTHSDGSPFIAMELLKGQDLQKAVRGGPPMSLDRKVAIIVQVLAGLAHAHQAGIVHRDIKPANIFIGDDGTVKIMDFGVARLTTASMTGTGNIVGTADYMSPEQVKGAKVDGRSDVFSVGCMLFELLTGQRPFHSDNLMAIFYKITHEEANLGLLPQGAEYEALIPLLQKSLSKNLDERYPSAYDFAVDLRQYLQMYATSRSGQYALEDLVDFDRPGAGPQGATLVDGAVDGGGATMDTSGRGLALPGTRATLKGAAPTAAMRGAGTPAGTARRPAAGTTSRPGGRIAPQRPTTMLPRPQPKSSSVGAIIAIVAVVGIGAGAGAYFFLKPKPLEPVNVAPTTPAPPVVTSAPATAVPVAPTSPPTAAPIASLGDLHGKAAGPLKAAQAAMAKGDYDRALEQAQSVLREDAANGPAQQIVDNALQGQKAQGQFRQAEDALRQGQWADAQRATESGRAMAPWDTRGPDLLRRIEDAEQKARQQAEQTQKQAEQQKQSQTAVLVNGYLTKAASELAADRYEAALALYDEALKVDPQNQMAISGKTNAVVAKKMAEAAAAGGRSGGAPGKGFVNGKTTGQSVENRGGAVPEGFEDTGGINVKKASQNVELPGRITFEIEPASVKAGDKYTVKIRFANEGNASVAIRDLVVTTVADGRRMSGPVPVTVKEVAPHQKETLLSLTDFWKDVASWSMEVTVGTTRGETYKNQVSWR
jgi:tetratricopeptide (TPR) repeat protein/tRNA A-37 threonylcarbamoyl transferase component Bud32